MGGVGLADATASGAIRLKGNVLARDVLVRMLDLRPARCVMKFQYARERRRAEPRFASFSWGSAHSSPRGGSVREP